jgi:hypothetical protein
MKKTLFFLIFYSFLAISYGQVNDYVPFPGEHATWITIQQNLIDAPGYWNVNQIFKLMNDTIIDSQEYHAIFTNNPPNSYFCAFREENKKIYFRFKDDSSDFLLYDFNLNVGDTMFYNFFDPTTEEYNHNKKVIAIDSISLLNGEVRKTYRLASISHFYLSDDIWVEGIGSITWKGLFNPLVTNYLLNGDNFKFGYFCNDNQDLFFDSDCEIHQCDVELAVNESEIKYIALYPNPCNDIITITTTNHVIESIELYNSIGQLIKSEIINKYDYTMPIKYFNPGIYFLKIKFNNQEITKKIIKL